MKTKEELNALKREVAELNKKLAELTDDELAQVIGGLSEIPPSDIQSEDILKITSSDAGK